MSSKTKTSHNDEKPKKAGRPPAGIPEDDAILYWQAVTRWVEQRKLAQWLQDPEQWVEAQAALDEQVTLKDTQKLGQYLNQWRQEWLSEEGWKRLQANVRQKRYLKGKPSKTGDKQPREGVRAMAMKVSTAVELKFYARSQNMTIDQAVSHLLELEASLRSR